MPWLLMAFWAAVVLGTALICSVLGCALAVSSAIIGFSP